MAIETQRWNYKIFKPKSNWLGSYDPDALAEQLNQLGRDGWELVSVVGTSAAPAFYLKRPA